MSEIWDLVTMSIHEDNKREENKQQEPILVSKMLLVEKVHYTFETWFIRMVQSGLLPEDKPFTIRELRLEYSQQCWKDEALWKNWSNNNAKE